MIPPHKPRHAFRFAIMQEGAGRLSLHDVSAAKVFMKGVNVWRLKMHIAHSDDPAGPDLQASIGCCSRSQEQYRDCVVIPANYKRVRGLARTLLGANLRDT